VSLVPPVMEQLSQLEKVPWLPLHLNALLMKDYSQHYSSIPTEIQCIKDINSGNVCILSSSVKSWLKPEKQRTKPMLASQLQNHTRKLHDNAFETFST
jgi:hypothetical protein